MHMQFRACHTLESGEAEVAAAASYQLTSHERSVSISPVLVPLPPPPGPLLASSRTAEDADGVDESLLGGIVSTNSFEFRASSELSTAAVAAALRQAGRPAHPNEAAPFTGRGLWALPSFINHACVGNVSHTPLADFCVVRAARDMPAGTEVGGWVGLRGWAPAGCRAPVV